MVMRKYFRIIVLIIICFGVYTPAYSQDVGNVANVDQDIVDITPVFFSNISDVPVMPGLYELADEAVVFDQPDGRIAESVAASEEVTIDAMVVFYTNALSNLGWNRQTDNSFLRGNERLKIKFESQGEINLVHVSVMPVR